MDLRRCPIILATYGLYEEVSVRDGDDTKICEAEDLVHDPHDRGAEGDGLTVEGGHDEGHVSRGLVVVHHNGSIVTQLPYLWCTGGECSVLRSIVCIIARKNWDKLTHV